MSTIDLSKKYRTRHGQEVRLYAADGAGPFPIHGARLTPQGWLRESWTELGSYHSVNREADYDLVEVPPPYSHIKIDDPVYVWDDDGTEKIKAHFAGISEQGAPLVYVGGQTSWTSQGPLPEWRNCELAFPDKENE